MEPKETTPMWLTRSTGLDQCGPVGAGDILPCPFCGRDVAWAPGAVWATTRTWRASQEVIGFVCADCADIHAAEIVTDDDLMQVIYRGTVAVEPTPTPTYTLDDVDVQFYVKPTSNCEGLALTTLAQLFGGEWSTCRFRADAVLIKTGEDLTPRLVVGWTDLYTGTACPVAVYERIGDEDLPAVALVGGNSGLRIMANEDEEIEPAPGAEHLPPGWGAPVLLIEDYDDIVDERLRLALDLDTDQPTYEPPDWNAGDAAAIAYEARLPATLPWLAEAIEAIVGSGAYTEAEILEELGDGTIKVIYASAGNDVIATSTLHLPDSQLLRDWRAAGERLTTDDDLPAWRAHPAVVIHDAVPAMADVLSGATHRPEPLAPGEDVDEWALSTHAWQRVLAYIAGRDDVQRWTILLARPGEPELDPDDEDDVALAREQFGEPDATVLRYYAVEDDTWLVALNEDGTRACTIHLDANGMLFDASDDELDFDQLAEIARDWPWAVRDALARYVAQALTLANVTDKRARLAVQAELMTLFGE